MYRRSRSKERRQAADAVGFDFDPLSVDKGDSQLRKQTKSSQRALDSRTSNGMPLEENFIGLEFKSTSSKKVGRTPMKTIIDKERSKEMEIRRSSPSLVARLMGLDTLPPSVAPYQKERVRSCQKTPPVGFHEKRADYEDYSRRTSTDEHHKCKDVFEVTEKPKDNKHHSQPIPKVMPSFKQIEKDVISIKKKLMDTKYLPTDDTYQQYKEHSEAFEVLHSNEDQFLNFCEEPHLLLKTHLQDLTHSPPSPHASHITLIKPSKGTKYEIRCKSERYAQNSSDMQKGYIRSSRKSEPREVHQSLKEHGLSLPCKLSDLQNTAKVKDLLQPAQIVVLKPSLEKVWGNAKSVPLAQYSENDEFSFRRHKKVPISRTAEFYVGGEERQKLSDSVEVMGHMTRHSKKIARNIGGKMRTTRSIGSKERSGSNIYGYVRDGSSYGMSNFDHEIDCRDNISTSSSSSTDSLLSKEAKKRMSERWKTAHLFQEVRPPASRSSTLGEMLASSDREIAPRMALNTSLPNISSGKVARGDIPEIWDAPLGISSRDGGWMDKWSRSLPRSKSHPASSLVYENHKPSRRNRFGGSERIYPKNVINIGSNDATDRNFRWRRTSSLNNFKYYHNDARFYYSREESQMSEREIHVNSEELRDGIHGEHGSVVPEVCNSSIADKEDSFMVTELCNDSSACGERESGNNSSPAVDSQCHNESAQLAEDVEFPVQDVNVFMAKEASTEQFQVDSLSCQGDGSSKDVDQINRVDDLEPFLSEEDKSFDCFDKISSDLHELRMQLRLLKFDTYAEDSDFQISSEEDNGDIADTCRDDEDRDFSYLLDLLIGSGVHDASQNGSLEYSVGPELFEKLEKKYSLQVSWPRTERKLLFDVISSILIDLITPFHNLQFAKLRTQAAWAREDLIEKVWQMSVKRRNEPNSKQDEQHLDHGWLDLGDDIETIAKNLGRMVLEDLVEELYSQMVPE